MNRCVLTILAGVAAAAVLLTACASTGFQYVHDQTTQTFLKVPTGWKLFDRNALLGTQPAPNPFQQAADPLQFVEAFSADPNSRASDIPNPSADQPQGFVLVHQLSFNEQDQLSLSTIRDSFINIDQMSQQDPNSVAVISYDGNVQQNGYHGIHILFSVSKSTDALRQNSQSYTVNQTGLVDPGTQKLYLFVIMCSSDCYQKNQKTIDLIANSWRVGSAT